MIDTERHASAPRIRRFLKHLGDASEKSRMMHKIERRKDFVQKINTLTSEEPSLAHEELIRADAKTIETQIRKALNLERQLFERQKGDENELMMTEQKVMKEDDEIRNLREGIGNFQQKVMSAQRFDEQSIQKNTERIDRITDMISKLSEKLDELSALKQNTESRAKEIETRIQQIKPQKQFEQPALPTKQPPIFLIKKKDIPVLQRPVVEEDADEESPEAEEQISKRDLKKHFTLLTKHHEKMVKAGYHSPQDLEKLQRKIDKLRKKLK